METGLRTAVLPPATTHPVMHKPRPTVRGKFLFIGEEKLYVKGATYGAFRPDADGNEYHNTQTIERDFAQMSANGLNAVRIPHTIPPRSLLDAAQRHGLYVMVGLSAEQYVGYLIDKADAPDIEELVRAKVRACAGHPALLCYALGNEIPAPIVRWLGRRRVERYLLRLFRAAKAEDPGGLFTYVNYPTTEYLQLPFLDLCSFNVYLESQDKLQAYLARLQNVSDVRPLIMSEVGLDSQRNGEEKQATILDWQVRTIFASGCAGAFIFSWTDEWHRAGAPVEDWDFGLTRRDRSPKPALASVREAFVEVPFSPGVQRYRISVVICAHNEEESIAESLRAATNLDYPDFEVIVVDDGSTDATAAIAREFGVRVITTANGGLSAARNIGLEAATGDIVAYLDADAYPDRNWLQYLAYTFATTNHVGVGGPNIHPSEDGTIAECVANAPGGPVHVLLSDSEAEHIPGCNMAFRAKYLREIGGFDPGFRVAGDDVDVCWQLQKRGWTLGFSPAAMVWHHRRDSMSAYLKQQRNYGKAEALLERKWPEKYNPLGHLTWAGRLYGNSPSNFPLIGSWRVYHGVWGSGAFQSIYGPAEGIAAAIALVPETFLLSLMLLGLALLSPLWEPLIFAWLGLVATVGLPVMQAIRNALRVHFSATTRTRRVKMVIVTALLNMLQPIARLYGRMVFGLVPWRRRNVTGFSVPRLSNYTLWSENWAPSEGRIQTIEAALKEQGAIVVSGGGYDRWEFEVRAGTLGAVRLRLASEDHGSGKQLIRVRLWPTLPAILVMPVLVLATLSVSAGLHGAFAASAILGGIAAFFALALFFHLGGTMGCAVKVLRHLGYKKV